MFDMLMSTFPEPQQELEVVARRLGECGYRFRRAPHFAVSGVLIYSPASCDDELRVFEKSVFIYARGVHWIARVTQHGGPHWIREVDSIGQLEDVALEALRSQARPPSSEWKVESS